MILSVPGNLYTVRHIKTPPADLEHVREMAAFEVAETLQIPLENIAWDYHISSHHHSGSERDLTWVAARKESISSLIAFFSCAFVLSFKVES